MVVNADSAQLYADIDIVAARPSPDELAAAPHRLYGVRDGALPCSAAEWAEMAKAEIAAVHAEEKLPILVGGTGLYIRTLLDGIAPVPAIDPGIRETIRAAPVDENYRALTSEDPEAAGRFNAADTTRVARALEVVRSTGKPLSYWQEHKVGGIGEKVVLAPLILLPPRDWLADRCEARFRQMIDEGAVEEVERLVARDLNPDLPVMRAIGVRELTDHAAGLTTREDAIARGVAATRQYAKRQYTWFRRQPPDDWPRFETPLDAHGALDEAVALIEQAL